MVRFWFSLQIYIIDSVFTQKRIQQTLFTPLFFIGRKLISSTLNDDIVSCCIDDFLSVLFWYIKVDGYLILHRSINVYGCLSPKMGLWSLWCGCLIGPQHINVGWSSSTISIFIPSSEKEVDWFWCHPLKIRVITWSIKFPSMVNLPHFAWWRPFLRAKFSGLAIGKEEHDKKRLAVWVFSHSKQKLFAHKKHWKKARQLSFLHITYIIYVFTSFKLTG